ncbi:discoidin domain-containing protein [Sciscionella sediminilitoris]|uniref:discoidin domain-containing protein n=1 Tax=Sciscionella sediminilitoris TaxID=1445613 RepID=UPI0006914AD2|nr:discoidin domain-containing protein [Sciscionella sp. SE31]
MDSNTSHPWRPSRRQVMFAAASGVIGVGLGQGSAGVAAGRTAGNERRELSLDTDWAFWRADAPGAEQVDHDDGRWAAVSLPHTMRLERTHPAAYSAFAGIGWYRRYFRLSPREHGRRLTLRFDGVQTGCQIYLNGRRLAEHHGGYLGFIVDITEAVQFDRDNVLAVRVDSSDDPLTPAGKTQDTLGFLTFGGIYRSVRLRSTDKVHITDPLEANQTAGGGVFITCPAADTGSARLELRTHVRNSGSTAGRITLVSTLLAPDGTVAGHATTTADLAGGEGHHFPQSLTVDRPALWHPDHPHLYRLHSQVLHDGRPVDALTTTTGIRRIEFRADGCYLNGERIYLRGANCHQNHAWIGDAAPASMQYRDALRIKLGGFNAVRAAHYPHDPAFLDAADELGLLVVACETGWQYYNPDPIFADRAAAEVSGMIRRDRNHPSVFLWETALNETAVPEAWARRMTALAHAEMPNDQMFTAADFGLWGKQYYDVCYKVTNPDGSDPDPAKPFLTREWGDWQDPCRASREDGEAALVEQVKTRQRYLDGAGYWDWGGLDANPRVGGYFLWVLEDYGTNDTYQKSGAVDIDRYPKYSYYWLQSMRPATAPMVRIANNNTATSSREILVFSNADRVRLHRNGRLLGERTRAENASSAPRIAAKGGSPYFRFELPSFEPGELRAEAFVHDALAATHTVRTPGAPHHIEIEADDGGATEALRTWCQSGDTRRALLRALQRIQPVADGCDLIPVHIKVTDEHGTVVPDADTAISLSVDGPGKLVGAGIPRIGAERQKLRAGIGFALIATSNRSGPVTLKATADGLRTGRWTVWPQPATVPRVADGRHRTWRDIATLEDQGTQNPALFKHTTASGSAAGTRSGNAVDDDESTEWAPPTGSTSAWWQVDLGDRFDLIGLQLAWAAGTASYTVQASDNAATWSTVIAATTGSATVTHHVTIRTRYLRVVCTGSGKRPGLREFRAIPPGTTGGAPPVDPGPTIDHHQVVSATASSSASGFDPAKAFDGDTTFGTGWQAASTDLPQTLTAKLAKNHTMAGIRVHWGKDSTTYTYNVQVSPDAKNWKTVLSNVTRTGQDTIAETFSQPDIRWIRLTVTAVTAGGGASVAGIAEVELYGTAS